MTIARQSDFVQPVELLPDGRVAKVSSGFGSRGTTFHSAVDMMALWKPGDPVGHPNTDITGKYTMPAGVHALSIADGVVGSVTYDSTRGWYVQIKHPATRWGYTSLQSGYQHLAAPLVKVGQSVRVGQRIGVIGIGGGVRHLHFALSVNGNLIDPKPWIETWPIIRPGGTVSVGMAVFLASSFVLLVGSIGYFVYVRSG
ncbi:hypothetical protein LCGC14_2125320 [marine sediment metagenome]|uniref:M23ase beta-sheet core domain-containing protein n=1 Tax=marine sediment metagenome TaxID=412755 RepID=A0A0F9E338_9ZZZZ